MAETVESIFDKAMALMNKYSEDGVRIPEDDIIDMKMKVIPLTDIAHKDVFEIARIDKRQEEPTTLTSYGDATQVNYKADQAIVYYVAARLAPFKKKELVQYFEDEWLRLRNNCSNKAIYEDIIDVYSPDLTEETEETEE